MIAFPTSEASFGDRCQACSLVACAGVKYENEEARAKMQVGRHGCLHAGMPHSHCLLGGHEAGSVAGILGAILAIRCCPVAFEHLKLNHLFASLSSRCQQCQRLPLQVALLQGFARVAFVPAFDAAP